MFQCNMESVCEYCIKLYMSLCLDVQRTLSSLQNDIGPPTQSDASVLNRHQRTLSKMFTSQGSTLGFLAGCLKIHFLGSDTEISLYVDI